jgi:hypothetical protein
MAIDGVLIPITLFVCGAVTAIGVPLAKAYARRVEREPTRQTLPSELTDRLDRMEQALDSIAIEVERVSEGQRFTTKLLSERNNAPPQGVTERQS